MRISSSLYEQSIEMIEGKMFPETGNKDKIVLDLCGGSGAFSFPYRENGYTVRIVDIANGHDVRLMKYFKDKVFLILACPPCTEFSNLKNWRNRRRDILEGLSVVDACMRIILLVNPKYWVLENPRGLLGRYLGPPRYSFNPCDFGDPWTKMTYLWGRLNFPIKNPVQPTKKDYIKDMQACSDRSGVRAITPWGFTRAFYEANKE